ncbi:MAG: nuclear transport factor 2 family protein [Gemmatimonadales bacterium]|nr:nuclear transport factor 2 family protein [Gemmatimonadales bacterium]
MSATMRVMMVAVAVVVTAGCGPAVPTPAAMEAAADSLDRRYLEAFNRGDVDAVTALYWDSPSLVSIGLAGTGIRGRDAFRTDMAETFKAMPGSRLEFTHMQNVAEGDVVLGWGRWRLTTPVPGGDPQVLEGRYSDVKALRNGTWVYVMDHASTPLLPPPPPPAP